MNPIDQIEKIIPARYVPYALFLAAMTPYLGRAYAALKNNHGIMGILRAIWLGDPKPLNQVKLADDTATQIFVKQQAYVPPPGPLAPPKA